MWLRLEENTIDPVLIFLTAPAPNEVSRVQSRECHRIRALHAHRMGVMAVATTIEASPYVFRKEYVSLKLVSASIAGQLKGVVAAA